MQVGSDQLCAVRVLVFPSQFSVLCCARACFGSVAGGL